MDTQAVVAIAAPLIALQLFLIVIALQDLVRPERRVRGVSKLVWGIVIVLGQFVGPLVYFAIGRDELER
jgi:hypothetical protein